MKFVSLVSVIVLLSACGGGSDGDGGTTVTETVVEGTPDCMIVMNSLSLSEGDVCNLTADDAGTYGISPGEVSCANSTVIYNGSQFQAGEGGINFSGLTFTCGA